MKLFTLFKIASFIFSLCSGLIFPQINNNLDPVKEIIPPGIEKYSTQGFRLQQRNQPSFYDLKSHLSMKSPFALPGNPVDFYMNSEKIIERWNGADWIYYQKHLSIFDAEGTITEEKIQSWNGTAWIDSFRQTRDYPGNNYVNAVQHWNGYEWINNYRFTYIYDSSYNMTGFLYEMGDSVDWINHMQYFYYRNPATQFIDSIVYQTWEMNAWMDEQKDFHIPDSEGRDSIMTVISWKDSVWENDSKYIYQYDPGSFTSGYIYQFWEGSIWRNYWRYFSSYNEDDYPLTEFTEMWNDTTAEWYYYEKYEYIYNENNQRTEYKYSSSPEGNAWENVWRYLYEYDIAAGRRTRTLYQNWNMEWKDERQTLYEYDSNGNNITELQQLMDSAGWVNQVRNTNIWVIVGTDAPEVVNSYRLYNNFPNPFNPVTTIRFSIAARTFVTLKVYDLPGKEVRTLLNEEKPAGEYDVQFDAGDLSSGVYFCRMQAGEFTGVRKLLLIK